MAKYFITSPADCHVLSSQELESFKNIYDPKKLINVKEVLAELSSADCQYSNEFVQLLLNVYMKFGSNYAQLKHIVASFIIELPQRISFSKDLYKTFLISHLIRAWLFDLSEKSAPENLAAITVILWHHLLLDANDFFHILFFLLKYIKFSDNVDKAMMSLVEGLRYPISLDNLSENAKKKVLEIGNSLKLFMRTENVSQQKLDNLSRVLNYLNVDSETTATANEEVSESFKLLVGKIQNEEEINENVQLENHEFEVKYFVEFAVKDVASAVKFAKVLPSLFHKDPCGAYLFRELITSFVFTNFTKQHSEETRNEFTETKTKATSRFIAELLVNGYMKKVTVDSTLQKIDLESFKNQLSRDCGALLLISLEYNSRESPQMTLTEYLDFYFEKQIDEAIQTGYFSTNWSVPGGEEIKRKWMAKLFDKCVKTSNNTPVLVALCKDIIKRNPCKFTFSDASKVFEGKMIEELLRKVGLLSDDQLLAVKVEDIDFFQDFLETGFIPKANMVNIWHVISQHVLENWMILPSFIIFLERSSFFVKNVNESETTEKLKLIRDILKPLLFKKELSDFRSKIRNFLKFFNMRIQISHPKTVLHKELYEGIDESFFEIVDKTINKDLFYGFNFNMSNPKVDAKFYFDHAVLNMQTAKDFGTVLTYIMRDEDVIFKQFQAEMLSLCEQRFIRQHSEATRSEYSNQEILATNHFICELLVKRYITRQKGDTWLKLIQTDENRSQISISCIPLLIMALSCFSLPDFDKKARIHDHLMFFFSIIANEAKKEGPESCALLIPMDTQIKKNMD